MLRPRFLSVLALAILGGALPAAEAPDAAPEKPKKGKKQDIPSATVVVSATRTERTEKETTTTVTVNTDREMELELVKRPTELVRFEPGVDVGSKPDRQGSTSYSIRGIGGNRVLILVDGVNLPDGPEAGRNFSRDFVDLDSVKRVEILRGSGSALYGSDALAGVVTFTTKDASDYLPEPRGLFAGLKLGYSSADNAKTATVTTAGRSGAWEGLLLGTLRYGHETTPALGTPNPMDMNATSVLGKVGWTPDARNRFRFVAQHYERHNEVVLLSTLGPVVGGPPGAPATLVTGSNGDDRNRRNQFSVSHVFEDDAAALQRVEWRVFLQEAKSLERTAEQRTPPPPTAKKIRYTDYRFVQKILGLRSQAEKRFSVGGWAHRVLFGLDVTRSETSRPYDRSELNVATGVSTKTVAGLTYPSKVMPDSTTMAYGLFVQGEVLSPSGTFSFVPGLRVDRYTLSPTVDAEFLRSNTTNLPVKSVANTAVSPKLGLIGKLDQTWTAYGQFAQGFRNPPYDNVNMAMTMASQGYMVVPNPDIKPERSTSLEAGLRGEGSYWSVSFAMFQNQYKDFITDVAIGPDPATGFLRFQFQNLQDVRIRGAELRGGCVFGAGFQSRLSLAYAEGDDLKAGQPIDSVAPFKAVFGLGYRSGETWGADLLWTGVARKSRITAAPPLQSQSTTTAVPYFKAPGFGLVDALAHYVIGGKGNWKLQAGVFNVLNKTCWRWEDVRGYQEGDPALPRYTQPGRNYSVSLGCSWR